MSERLNKTSICSVVFLDIIDYSKQPVSRQIADKEQFNALLSEAIKDIAQNDRIILDTGDGAAISLLGAPEEALFVSLTIRDGILNYNKGAESPLYVRIGINLGPVRVVRDINGQPNIIGDGINVAQRVMSFADANQILVSRSYYEVTSRLSDEITGLFSYSGIKQDKHVREHEVYAIRSAVADEVAKIEEAPLAQQAAAVVPAEKSMNRWLIPAAVLLVLLGSGLPFLFGTFSKQDAGAPIESAVVETPAPVVAEEKPKAVESKPAKAAPAVVKKTETKLQEKVADKAEEPVKDAPKKKVAKKAKPAETATTSPTETHTAAESRPSQTTTASGNETAKPAEKTGWETFTQSVKQGAEKKPCTQAEIALNQCR